MEEVRFAEAGKGLRASVACARRLAKEASANKPRGLRALVRKRVEFWGSGVGKDRRDCGGGGDGRGGRGRRTEKGLGCVLGLRVWGGRA